MSVSDKERSRLGDWLDRRSITQQWLSNESGIIPITISELACDNTKTPTVKTLQKFLKALRGIDPRIKVDCFWDM